MTGQLVDNSFDKKGVRSRNAVEHDYISDWENCLLVCCLCSSPPLSAFAVARMGRLREQDYKEGTKYVSEKPSGRVLFADIQAVQRPSTVIRKRSKTVLRGIAILRMATTIRSVCFNLCRILDACKLQIEHLASLEYYSPQKQLEIRSKGCARLRTIFIGNGFKRWMKVFTT